MEEIDKSPARRDRSPSFPYIGLEKAVERARMLFTKARRNEVRIVDAALDWGLGPKSSATLQTVSALLAFGLIEDSGSGESRKIRVSDTGWRLLEDNRPGVRETLLAELALRPRLIAEYYARWKDVGRPEETHAISQLMFDSGLNDEAALKFLRVYEETVKFVPETVSDLEADIDAAEQTEGTDVAQSPLKPASVSLSGHVQGGGVVSGILAGERVLATGMLSKEAQFKVVVSGKVGTKEIDVLIRKLQLDREVLAGDEDTPIAPVENNG